MGLSKKQLSGADIFQRTAMRFGDWCQRNLVRIAIVIVPTIVVIFVVLGMQLYMNKQKSKRMDMLASIDAQLQQDSVSLSQRTTDLQTRIDKLTKPDQEGNKDKGNKEDKKTAETLRKQLDDLKAKQEQAAYSRYNDFFQQHPQSAEGWAAGMNAVGIAIQAKRYDDAKAILEKILLHSTDQQFHQTQGRILYVKVLEDSGNFDQALGEIDKAYAIVSDEHRPSLLLIKARILLAQDQLEQATKAYEKIISDFASAPEASRARSIMMVLN